jgi:hypothetical protein
MDHTSECRVLLIEAYDDLLQVYQDREREGYAQHLYGKKLTEACDKVEKEVEEMRERFTRTLDSMLERDEHYP